MENAFDLVQEHWPLMLVLYAGSTMCVGCVAMTVGMFLRWRRPVTVKDGVRELWAVMNGR
jgi:hypothetical protein